ncbi:MAG: hypothetical protein CJBNEKGG_03433 [Prosthecobacter sp.]|nr:hypothetical protein [Prosthecobacter sp.]
MTERLLIAEGAEASFLHEVRCRELRGRFRILQGPPQPFVQETSRWQWICRNTDPKPGCENIAFEPHGR